MTIRTDLTSEQLEAVERMVGRKRFCLADGTGKGKTLSTLAAFDRLLVERPERRMLVLANKGSLPTWSAEIPKHTDLTHLVGGTEDRDWLPARWRTGDPRVVVLSYPSVTPRAVGAETGEDGVSERELVQAPYRDELVRFYAECDGSVVLVLEEAHYLKTPGTRRRRVADALVRASEYAWMLTATPMSNRIEELHGVMDLLVPGLLGSRARFLRDYTVREKRRVGRDRWVWEVVGYRNLDRLKERVSGYMLKRALDLDIRFERVDFDLSPEEEDAYLMAAAGVLDESENVRDFGARLPDLQLVVDGAVTEGREPNDSPEPSSKEAALLGGLKEAFSCPGKAAVVYCHYLATFERLRRVLAANRAGIVGLCRLLTVEASDTTEERLATVRSFGSGDLLLMTGAGKESLNLGAADELWLYNVPWSAGDAMQVVGRITRMDSPHESFIVKLPTARGTIDEYKLKVWAHKSDVFGRVLKTESSMLQAKSNVTRADLRSLRKELLWRTKGMRR